MAQTRIAKIQKTGQSVWLDNIHRKMLVNGDLLRMVESGEIWGVTSNPTIFNHAISKSKDYDDAINTMTWAGMDTTDIFWQLACEDVQRAADVLHPVFEKTAGQDGYVSIEVDPHLACSTKKTLEFVRYLWNKVNRPNLMVKIPATIPGLGAIQAAIAEGININITLIFSVQRYEQVIEAYFSGLEERLAKGKKIDHIHSVASFFVSRVDSKVDNYLAQKAESASESEKDLINSLLGKIAVANSKMAYELFLHNISSERFKHLQSKGATIQRPLWASTSTKNPDYRDVMYVEDLIGRDTVNTMPPQTITAFNDHGIIKKTIELGIKKAKEELQQLEELGISLKQVTDELESEGVQAFSESYDALFKSIDACRENADKQIIPIKEKVAKRIKWIEKKKFSQRLMKGDATLWTKNEDSGQEIKRRIGWLNAPDTALAMIPDLVKFVADCRKAGFSKALVLGMGGSSLAPEVYSLVFGPMIKKDPSRIEVRILDSTDPEQVKDAERFAIIDKTLFIVSSKSGSTSEINAFLDYFWEKVEKKLGRETGKHFIAITDPGTSLEKLARERKFKKVFTADPNVGGRYSALTYFGLVPAALIGLDLNALINWAMEMKRDCSAATLDTRNPGFLLGAILGEAYCSGRDKLTILTDQELESFGSWLEQLVAESSGKDGKGIIPVDTEPLVSVSQYSDDRIFVYLRTNGSHDELVKTLQAARKPIVVYPIQDVYQLGGEFYRWEVATAIACALLGVNAFDQPDVQFNKKITQQKIMEFKEIGHLIQEDPIYSYPCFSVFANKNISVPNEDQPGKFIKALVRTAKQSDYIAINAYLPRNAENTDKLEQLRKKILVLTGNGTTLGFGPRFLHSTGQLHKGGANNGLFIEITHEVEKDLKIPDEGITFGILEMAQAIGDFDALRAKGRRVYRIHLTTQNLDDLLKW